jgi:histidinol dehydrogenase
VEEEIERLLRENSRASIARASLERNGLIVIARNLADAAEIANLRAPEHLELLVQSPMELAARIRNAGAIFLGSFSPEPVGDYFAGPNHILPTGGTARWASPLGTYDFLKRTSLIGYSRERLDAHAADVIRLAEAEGLPGHAAAIRARMRAPNPEPSSS